MPVISVAPMMAYTDRHFRYLLRLISKSTVLYTEMVTARAIYHGDRDHLLKFHQDESPVVLQLGGNEPDLLAKATKIAQDWGYDAVNLNVGCPSPRVQKGCFGAALMKQPSLVAECFDAMQSAVTIPVTVKTRLGVDDFDSDDFLHQFIRTVSRAGCKTFILHARKAWLNGLSPKENRHIPPLQYDRVYRLKELFPELSMHINGGIQTIDQVQANMNLLDGVMLGRAVCSNPYLLADIDQALLGEKPPSRLFIVKAFLPYLLEQYHQGVPMRHMTRHLIGLYQGVQGAKKWRQILSDGSKDDKQLIRAAEAMMAL